MPHHQMLPKSLFLALIFVGSAGSQPAHSEATCKCVDMSDIKSRISESQAAIQTYRTEIKKMANQQKREGNILVYTAERREKLQGRVQLAMNAITLGSLGIDAWGKDGGPGGTNNLCQVTVNPDMTACVQESIRRHEEIHRQACLKTESLSTVAASILKGKDRFERDNSTLIAYAQEEIKGYEAELRFLNPEFTALKKRCKPETPPLPDYTAQRRNPGG